MTKEEFYSNIREYKANKSLKHGNDPEVWERDSFDFAVAALTKSKLAKYAGEVADASKFETEYNGYMNKLAHMDERAAKALEQKVLASAEAKYRECLTKLIAAKHSDESVNALSHGGKWKEHKYIRIENGRYIYPDDEKIKNSKEDKYVVLRKEAYKKSNDANIAAVAGGHSSENDIAAAVTRSQASGMRRTADLLEAQMNEQKRREQESKKEADSRWEELAKENHEKLKNLNAELAIKRANRQRDTSENRRSEEIQKTREKEQLEKDANDAADNFINAVIKEANNSKNIQDIGWWASNDRGSATQSITKKYAWNEDFEKSFEQNVQKKLSQIVTQINPEARGKVEAFIKQYFKR